MRFLLSALAVALLALSPAMAQSTSAAPDLDATKADAEHHKVEFENEQVRVVRYVIPPHVKTPMHSHPALVFVPLTDANAKITTQDGKTTESHVKSGAVAWRPAVTHEYENIGDQPIEGVLVEPKKPNSALPAGAPDALQGDPAHHQVEFENEQVRVVRYHAEPGAVSPMHAHPDNVQIALTDARTTSTTPDGKTTPAQIKARETRWRPAGQHTVRNTGESYEGIIVEMKGGTAPASGK